MDAVKTLGDTVPREGNFNFTLDIKEHYQDMNSFLCDKEPEKFAEFAKKWELLEQENYKDLNLLYQLVQSGAHNGPEDAIKKNKVGMRVG